MINKFIGLG